MKLIIKSTDYYKDGGSLSLETNLGEIVVDKHFEFSKDGSNKAIYPTAGRCTWGYYKEERAEIKELTIEQIKELLDILDTQIPGQFLDFKQYAKEIRAFYNL